MTASGPQHSLPSRVVRRATWPVRRRYRDVMRWARRTHFAQRGPIPVADVFPVQPPTPLPPGTTEAGVREMLGSVSIDGAPAAELSVYLDECFLRVLHTWDLVQDLHGRTLELGANPYYITTMLTEHTDLELNLANYFGPQYPGPTFTQSLSYTGADGAGTKREVTSAHFNLEEEPFPWADDTFDVVIFCEILEHLLMDPVRVLREIHRVLRPDGTIVLTTPNVDRFENVHRLVVGANIYDPYSFYGPYGRHNREYNRNELHLLLGHLGFEIDRSFTADAFPHAVDRESIFAIEPMLHFRRLDLGQYLFVRARATSEPGAGKPSFLYRSYPPEELDPVE